MSIVLGIDPGSRITGYGIIAIRENKPFYLTSGCIKLKDDAMADRLHKIFSSISQLIREYQPERAAIEEVFMHRNPSSALKLGQARGAAMVAIASHHIPLGEYSARQVKQSVVGYGAAQKSQVQHMVCTLLQLDGTPQTDAADALAIALCHHYSHQGLAALKNKV